MLTQKRLKELLHYDADTGLFTRLTAPCNRVKIGDIAGNAYGNGYLRIGIDGKDYSLHRLAWMYVNGIFPVNEIDHINHDKEDNRIDNLRDVTSSTNKQNKMVAQKNNLSTGMLGACFCNTKQKYVSQICINGKHKFIGYFTTAEDAHEAYIKAKRDLHPGGML